MKHRSVFRAIITSFAGMALLFAGVFTSGNPTLAQEQEPVSAYLPVITQTCEGFTYSHPAYRSPNEYLGDAVAYEYSITGAGETATTSYTADQIITVSYTDTTISNNSTVTLWASYESGFRNQLGQSQVFSDPCEVEPPFEGVMVYSPVITQTCEGFTYSHTDFRSPNEYLGDAERYEIVVEGDGAIERQAYAPDTVISVTYADATVQNNSEVRLFADYGDGTWFQLGVTQISPNPCEVEDPGNGEEVPGNGDDNGNGDELPGNGDDNGNGEEAPGNGGDNGNGDEVPGNGDDNGNGNGQNGAGSGAENGSGDSGQNTAPVTSLPSTGSGSATAGLLVIASATLALLGSAAMISRFGITRR